LRNNDPEDGIEAMCLMDENIKEDKWVIDQELGKM
jgi:hypothetical protein